MVKTVPTFFLPPRVVVPKKVPLTSASGASGYMPSVPCARRLKLLYVAENDLVKKPYVYDVAEFPPGTTSPGRQRITNGLHMISELAA